MIDHSRISDVEVEGIDYKDYPDFCDAFISNAFVDGRPASDDELDEINQDQDFVYQKILDKIF